MVHCEVSSVSDRKLSVTSHQKDKHSKMKLLVVVLCILGSSVLSAPQGKLESRGASAGALINSQDLLRDHIPGHDDHGYQDVQIVKYTYENNGIDGYSFELVSRSN